MKLHKLALALGFICTNAFYAHHAQAYSMELEMVTKEELERLKPKIEIFVDKAAKNTTPEAQAQRMNVIYMNTHYLHYKVSTAKETMVQPPTGPAYKASTPIGVFKFIPDRRYERYQSKQWDGADMPWAQFFDDAEENLKFRGFAIHAASASKIPLLGKRDTGGCIRLHPRDAQELFKLVDEVGVENAVIIIYDSSTGEDPYAARPLELPPQVQRNGLGWIY